MKKPYPIDGYEEDITYDRNIFGFRSNIIRFIKRKMNKRFRRKQNISELEDGLDSWINRYTEYDYKPFELEDCYLDELNMVLTAFNNNEDWIEEDWAKEMLKEVS